MNPPGLRLAICSIWFWFDGVEGEDGNLRVATRASPGSKRIKKAECGSAPLTTFRSGHSRSTGACFDGLGTKRERMGTLFRGSTRSEEYEG
jgi:hypothetical protein